MTGAAPGAGGRFPPVTPDDIDGYDPFAMVDGYLSHEAGDPEPGPNRQPGFRWGWANRRRDGQREDDGFDALRHAYLAQQRVRPSPGRRSKDG